MNQAFAGFETVTIAFQGEIEHRDSTGNRDVIHAGDVQWMTAGRGIIHEEYHSRQFAKTGGVLEMCQLWVNLPSHLKMTAPKYQPIFQRDIPAVPLHQKASFGNVRVIAGEYNGVKGPASTHTPINVWDIILSSEAEGADLQLPVPHGHNTILFVRQGSIQVGTDDSKLSAKKRTMGHQQVALLSQSGNMVHFTPLDKSTQVVLLGGKPLDEPIAARGPFVMNTQAELAKANQDYFSGRLAK